MLSSHCNIIYLIADTKPQSKINRFQYFVKKVKDHVPSPVDIKPSVELLESKSSIATFMFQEINAFNAFIVRFNELLNGITKTLR